VLGTPQYMAPEQIERPREVDHRADIYSLGVVFYQMLTGELPQPADGTGGTMFAPPSRKVLIDVRLDKVVLRALHREPARRYQQVGEVRTQVETILATGDANSPQPPLDQPPFRPANPPPGVQPSAGAPPVPPETQPQLDRARQTLRKPAIGMIVAAAVNMATIFVLGTIDWIIADSGTAVYDKLFHAFSTAGVGLLAIGFMLWASIDMLKARGRARAITACVLSLLAVPAVLAFLPYFRLISFTMMDKEMLLFLAPAFLVGLPMGIWALSVLCRREVAGAFKLNEQGKPTKKSRLLLWSLAVVVVAAAAFLIVDVWPEDESYEIHGRVLDAATGEPVPGAMIRYSHSGFRNMLDLECEPTTVVHSDHAGQYVLRVPDRDDTRDGNIAAFAPGYVKLGTVVPSREKPTYDFTLRPVAADQTTTGRRPAPPPPSVVTLPSGVKVQLVGVTDHPQEGPHQKWLAPDGAWLSQKPHDGVLVPRRGDNPRVQPVVTPRWGERAIETSVFLRNLPDEIGLGERTILDSWAFEPNATQVTSCGYSMKPSAGRSLAGLRAAVFVVPADQQTITVKYGFAAGPWTTIATWDGQGPLSQNVTEEVRHGDATMTLTKRAYILDKGTPHEIPEARMDVDHNVFDQALRVIAVNKRGEVMGVSHYCPPPPGREFAEFAVNPGDRSKIRLHEVFGQKNINKGDITNRGYPTEELHEFRVQVSPFQWAEFRDVALTPSETTTAADATAAAMAARSAQAMSLPPFGPVMTRILPEYYSGGLKLVTGEIVVLPRLLTSVMDLPPHPTDETINADITQRRKQFMEFVAEHEIDLILDNFDIRTPDRVVLNHLPNVRFEDVTQADLEEALAAGLRQNVTRSDGWVRYKFPYYELPLMFALRTKAGQLGVLELIDYSEESDSEVGIKTRYKLLPPTIIVPPQKKAEAAK